MMILDLKKKHLILYIMIPLSVNFPNLIALIKPYSGLNLIRPTKNVLLYTVVFPLPSSLQTYADDAVIHVPGVTLSRC